MLRTCRKMRESMLIFIFDFSTVWNSKHTINIHRTELNTASWISSIFYFPNYRYLIPLNCVKQTLLPKNSDFLLWPNYISLFCFALFNVYAFMLLFLSFQLYVINSWLHACLTNQSNIYYIYIYIYIFQFYVFNSTLYVPYQYIYTHIHTAYEDGATVMRLNDARCGK